jgi:predicted ATP-grasp superfamily ATP-dependent carboligase
VHEGGVVRHAVAYAGSAEDLSAAAAAARGPLLVQEYVPGTGQGVELLLRDGVPLAAFQHRRIREVPVTGGASAFRVSVPLDPELLAPSVALLRELRWTGLAMVEFRVGPGGPRLMEINGRIWGSLPLAVRAGVDFPGMLADLFLGAPLRNVPPIGAYRLGVTSRNLPLEASWIGSVLAARRTYPFLETPPRRAALAALLRVPAPDGWDVLSLDDPLPGLVEVERLAEHAVGRVAGAAARRARRRTARGGDSA